MKSLFDYNIINIPDSEIIKNEITLGRWLLDAFLLLFSEEGEGYQLQRSINIPSLHTKYYPDIYLEKGCKEVDIIGKTIIDLKYNLLIDMEIVQSDVYRAMKDDGLVNNIYVIYINAKTTTVPKALVNVVTFVDASIFVGKLKKAIEEGKGLINQKVRKRKNQTNDWKNKRDKILERAIYDFNQYRSVIFTGAGVGVSANLPSWEKLLKSMIPIDRNISDSDYDEIYKKMGWSNLIMARYLQTYSKIEKSRVIEGIKNLLYPSKTSLCFSELIKSICKLILSNPKIESVITYNYDTLIEDYLRTLGKTAFSVFNKNRSPRESFPVYHVHGVIFNRKMFEPDDIVLSEEDYHKKYLEVYDWSNVEQLHALTRNTCFFIGLSMIDPNLRRLLDIARKDSGKAQHYVFLERMSKCHCNNQIEEDFNIRERLMENLGLNVIWYDGRDNHKELPELLNRFLVHNK